MAIGTTSPNSLGQGLIGGTTPKAFQLDNVGTARAIISSTVSPELWLWNFGAGTDLKGFYTRVDTSGNLITAALADNYGVGTDNIFTIQHDGQVGIGTTGQTVNLNVHEAGSGAVEFKVSNDTTGQASDGMALGIDASEIGFLWNYENTDRKSVV